MANTMMKLFRKRGLLLVAISAISALLAAKGQPPINTGFWDGPG